MLRAQSLPKRVLADLLAELYDKPVMLAERQFRVDALFEYPDPVLIKARCHSLHNPAFHVRPGWAAP